MREDDEEKSIQFTLRMSENILNEINEEVDRGDCYDRSDFIRGAVVRRLRELKEERQKGGKP